MNTAIVITARGGQQSSKDKNLIPILGRPVVTYPMQSARDSYAGELFVCTNCPRIEALADEMDLESIPRPESLSTPTSGHSEVILHIAEYLQETAPHIENLIILLGNTVMVTPAMIRKACAILDSGEYTGVMTGWKAQDDHPYRALKLNEDGFVRSFLDVDAGSNRQGYPPVYFYDNGIWGCTLQSALEQSGPPPWKWLGPRCKLIEREWVTGRDIHTEIDVLSQIWYLNSLSHNDH